MGFPDFEITNLMDKENYFIYLNNKKRNKYSYIRPILDRLANVCCAYFGVMGKVSPENPKK
jgi:hypothetical protein